jgi:hypothetical protein
MISLHGLADGLVAFDAMAAAFRKAVQQYGNPALYRLYGIANAGHVDLHADGGGDFDFDGIPGNEGMADLPTPMQAYLQRAFGYLIDWVEGGGPPDSKVIPTDPVNGLVDSGQLGW